MIDHCRKYLKIGKVSLRSLKNFSCLSFCDLKNTEWFYQRPSETGIFSLTSGCDTNFSGQVPKGNVDLRLVSRSDPFCFRIESDKGNLPDFPVSAYDEVPAGILLPSSGAFPAGSGGKYAGTCRKVPEKAPFPAGSFRIRWPESSTWAVIFLFVQMVQMNNISGICVLGIMISMLLSYCIELKFLLRVMCNTKVFRSSRPSRWKMWKANLSLKL